MPSTNTASSKSAASSLKPSGLVKPISISETEINIMMDEESRYKIGPATKYAQDFVKRVKRPLTEDDLAHAFSAGKDFGRSTEWQRVDEVTPSPKYNGEQIAVLFEMSRNIYDIKVVKVEDFAQCIGSRNTDAIPLYWGYLRTIFTHRIKFPKPKKKL